MRSTITRTPVTTTAATPSTTRSGSGRAKRRAESPPIDRRWLIPLAGIGVLLVLMGMPRILSGAFIFSHEPVLRLIQRNAEVPMDRLLAAEQAYEAAIAWHAGAQERAALAGLRRHLGLMLGSDTQA